MIMCPSTDFSESTHVLALRNKDGRLTFLDSLMPIPGVGVDQLTVEDLRDRVRLTGPCVASRCAHWAGHCTLGQALSLTGASAGEQCAITDSCRWRIENGDRVCGICTSVMRMKDHLDD